MYVSVNAAAAGLSFSHKGLQDKSTLFFFVLFFLKGDKVWDPRKTREQGIIIYTQILHFIFCLFKPLLFK